MKSTKWDLMISGLLVFVLAIFLAELRGITPIARIYPLFVIIGSFVMIAVVAAQSLYRSRRAASGQAEEPLRMSKSTVGRIFWYGAAILAYIVLMGLVGYFISTIAFMVFSLLYQKNRSKALIIGLPLVFTVFLYVVFTQFLYVTLPIGSLIEKLF